MTSQTEFTFAPIAAENLRKPMELYLLVRPIGITMAVRVKTSAGGKAHLKRQIEIVRVESAAIRKTAKSKGESLERQLVLLKAQYDACDREKFTIYENYREGKLTPEEYLSGKDALAQKQAALKEQLETCETQLEVLHQQSLNAEEQHEAASRMTGLPDDKLREHLYDAVERVLVYDTETIEIVWKFNEAKIDTDENIGVAK